jgi:glyoxylase-like metal-dependent hydrolase (beta-lactamase superfamily II)
MYDVIILKEGYTRPEPRGTLRACGTITLLKSANNNIVVDTGNPWDKDTLLKGLSDQCLSVEDIQYVICTHCHSDHCGNLNLFTKAVHIVGFDICQQDQYYLHDFKQGIPYEIDDDIEIWPTPGHTGSDVSVVVRNTNLGTVAVAGDLFECEADLENPSIWQEQSEQPHLQEQSRIDILRVADFIIPGHGPMFQVPQEYKKQMRVVMMMEEHYSSADMMLSKTECIIVETD